MPTRADLRVIVRQDSLLNSTDVISDADLNTLLLEGAVQFAKDGHPFILSASFNTVASQQEYVLSGASAQTTGFLELYWPTGGLIYTQSSGVTKSPPQDFTVVSEAWLDREYAGWQDLTASDTLEHVYLGFNSSGYAVLGAVPKPSTTTPSFKVWYVSRGTDMSADANYPYTNGTSNLTHHEPYTKALAYYAMYVLHRDKTKMEGEAEKYFQFYQALAVECREAQQRVLAAELQGLREEGRLWAGQTFGSL